MSVLHVYLYVCTYTYVIFFCIVSSVVLGSDTPQESPKGQQSVVIVKRHYKRSHIFNTILLVSLENIKLINRQRSVRLSL